MIFKKVFPILLLVMNLAGCSAFGFQPKYVKNWPQVKAGMTKVQIEALLGEPESVKSAFKYDKSPNPLGKAFINLMFDGWYEKWYYGDNPSIVSTVLPFFPFGPPSKAYIVYFDDSGKVAGYLEPVIMDDDHRVTADDRKIRIDEYEP